MLPVGQTARAAWRVYRRQPWRFVWLLIIPILVSLPFSLMQAAAPAALGDYKGAATFVAVTLAIVGFIVQYGTQFVCQAASIYGSSRALDGAFFTTTEAMRAGFSRLLSFVGVFFLVAIIVLVGFVLLIIPALIAGVYLSLAIPACVLERRGPIASLQRSFDLVRGNWWRTLGTFWLALLVPMLAIVAIGVIVYLICAAAGVKALAFILVPFAIPAFLVLAAVGTLMPGVVFIELRRAKEGGGSHGTVSGVFD